MSHGSIFQSNQLVTRVYITVQSYVAQNDRAKLAALLLRFMSYLS
jgi:hypothetical protein